MKHSSVCLCGIVAVLFAAAPGFSQEDRDRAVQPAQEAKIASHMRFVMSW